MATKANAIPSALACNARLVAVLEIDVASASFLNESSIITTSELWLAAVAPLAPIAIPISAAASAAPVNVFVVHGESGVAESFSDLVHQKLGWNSRAPKDGDSVVL